jgi:membrane protease YdiL (CAAX protease family)
LAVAVSGLILVAAAWMLTRSGEETGRLLGMSRPAGPWLPHFAMLLLPLLFWPRLLGVPFQIIWPDVPVSQYPGTGIGVALTIVVLVPLVEEMLFRGALIGAIRPFGKVPALTVSAVLFGLGHGPSLFLSTVLIGWVLGWLAWEYRSIWPGVALHAAFNLSSGLGAWTILDSSHGGYVLPLVVAVFGLSVGGLVITVKHRALLRRVVVEPWKEARTAGGLGREMARAFRLWPVVAMAVFCLLVWLLAFVLLS